MGVLPLPTSTVTNESTTTHQAWDYLTVTPLVTTESTVTDMSDIATETRTVTWTITTTTTPSVTPTTTVAATPITVTTPAYVYGTQTMSPVEYVGSMSACPTTSTSTTPTAPTTTAPLLANTGSNSAPALVLGLLFILGGSAILALVYRRQSTR